MADVSGGQGPVPHFPRISAADRADGSVDVLVQGQSRVFEPDVDRGADHARLRSLRFLGEIAADLGRGVRVTTWTLDRTRASLVVLPSGECYDEADPEQRFMIEDLAHARVLVAAAAGHVAPPRAPVRATPSADIPAAVRGLDRAPVVRAPAKRRRSSAVVAGVLAMLLLWSGVVAILLTSGHHTPAVADSQLTVPAPPVASTPPSAPSQTQPSHAPSPSAPPSPVLAAPPTVDAVGSSPGALSITVSGTGATKTHPVTMHLRIDPATGATIRRSLRVEADVATMSLDKLPGGQATWVVLVPGAHLVKGHTLVQAAPVKHPPTQHTGTGATGSTAPTVPTPTTTPTTTAPPPTTHHHHHGTSSGNGGHTHHPSGGSQPTHPTHTASPPPPHPHADRMPRG